LTPRLPAWDDRPWQYRSPNQNAYIARFVQAIGRECLDKFIVFEQEHLDHVCREYVEHYHAERPHRRWRTGR
jgi:hypothetical protein